MSNALSILGSSRNNCAGSGTTGIACLNTKRNYILMEKEQNYFEIINTRIQKHKIL
jgi:site-specific DNA-methyltransferase (adenine-specific)